MAVADRVRARARSVAEHGRKSDDTFFLAQLDCAFESSHAHLASAMRGFLKPTIGIRESDSHYHMQSPQVQSARIAPAHLHLIPPRIQARIEEAYAWYDQINYAPSAPG